MIKKSVLSVIVLIGLYNSVYFKPLDEVKKSKNALIFNAKKYANDFMSSKIKDLSAIKASQFLEDVSNDVNQFCKDHGEKLGISNTYYFVIEDHVTVVSVEEENVVVAIHEHPAQKIKIATDFIFGNAIREGANVANIGDYQNTMDYNNISVELNNVVRENIIPPFIKKVKKGDTLYFKGATKINVKNSDLSKLRVIPLILNFNN